MEPKEGQGKEEGKELQITDEFLKDLEENPDKLEGMSLQDINAIQAELEKRDEEGAPAGDEPKPDEGGEKKESKGEEKKEEPSVDLAAIKTEVKKWSDEENKWKQKANSKRKSAEKAKEDFEKLSKEDIDVSKIDVDPIDEASFKEFVKEVKVDRERNRREIEFLRGKLNERDHDDASYYEQQASDAGSKRVFNEINSLQSDYPVLKTKEDFEKLNTQYAEYLDGLVSVAGLKEKEEMKDKDKSELRDIALKMHNTDAVFRDKVKGLGVAAPEGLQDKEEMEKYEIITSLYEKTQEHGGTLRGAWLERLDATGQLEKIFNKGKRDAAVEASRRTADAIVDDSPTPLGSSDGPGEKPSDTEKMTMDRAKIRSDALTEAGRHRRLKPEEMQELEQLLDFLEKVEG